jgi:hypothetical protein
VLVGLLAGLWLAVPSQDDRDREYLDEVLSRLTRAWERTRSRTTDISRLLVEQAVVGWFGASVHALIGALGSTDIEAVSLAARGLMASGASSGADTCVGLAACGPVLSRLSPEGILP